MNKIKILTVGEESYQITDPEAAHLSDGQISEEAVWSAKYLIDRLCPGFTGTGEQVSCRPFPGYPLQISAPEASVIHRCGKNLWNLRTGVSEQTYTATDGSVVKRYGYSILLPAGVYTVHAEPTADYGTDILSAYVNGADGTHKTYGRVVYNAELTTATVTVEPGDILYVVNGKGGSETGTNTVFGRYNLQIEAGSAATPYEQYRQESVAPGQAVAAWEGVNTFRADAGLVTVAGKLDPLPLFAKL